MSQEKKTYGQKIVDHHAKKLQLEDNIREYSRQTHDLIIKNIEDTIQEAKDAPQYRGKDFYIVLLTKIERLGQVPRTLVFARQSCPTPSYAQAVWKYHQASATLEYFWCIPDKFRSQHMIREPQKYLNDKEYANLAKFVHLMESGELLKWVIRENDHKKEGILKVVSKDESEGLGKKYE